ncbi:hypothetical protein CRG98_033517 [Punica granatum]|uniref:Uncharacterized protein n=1 Tax=Punica granatum TaxID=22663 RepID=A0A2I0IQ43_PUNGR|nr:hypothetical protein CRG98_033517 [Punica granatum]
MNRSDRTHPKEKPPGRALGRTGRVGLNGFGLGLRSKRNGPRPVSRKAVEIAENGGDGGSCPWTPRFQPIIEENREYPRFGGSGPAGITGSR